MENFKTDVKIILLNQIELLIINLNGSFNEIILSQDMYNQYNDYIARLTKLKNKIANLSNEKINLIINDSLFKSILNN